jgi:hypothetical protein
MLTHKHITRYADDKPDIERQARRASLATGRQRDDGEFEPRLGELLAPACRHA